MHQLKYALAGLLFMSPAIALADDAAPAEGTTTEGASAEVSADATAGGATASGEAAVTTEGGDAAMAAPSGMLLAAGKLKITVPIEINLSKDLVGKPISITPDVWYGVSDKLEVGLAHSSMGLAGWWGGFPGLGGGLCLTGTDNGCEKVYNGPVGLLAHFGLAQGDLEVAADGGLVIARLSDPNLLDLKLGAKIRKMAGKIAIQADPNLWIGLNKRDEGNLKQYINIPVAVGFAANEKAMVGVQTGIQGPTDSFGDFYSIPLNIGATFAATPNVTVGGSFNLLRIAGYEGPGAADLRSLTVFAEYKN